MCAASEPAPRPTASRSGSRGWLNTPPRTSGGTRGRAETASRSRKAGFTAAHRRYASRVALHTLSRNLGRRLQIGLAVLLVVLIGAAVAAYAWDQSKQDEIANGIKVGGVPIGGLSADKARHKLNRRLVKPLRRPVTVVFQGKRYVLSAKRLHVHADLDGMVEAAEDASRSGSLPTRIWRYATGDEVDRNLRARVGYSHRELRHFVSVAAEAIDRAPQDATVQPTPSSLVKVPGHSGLSIEQVRVRHMIEHQIDSGRRTPLRAPVRRTKPSVTMADLASRYPTYLTIDRGNFTLRLWKNLKLVKSYPIAVGMQGLETPAGTYTIDDKQVNPSWHVPNSDWAGDLAGQVIPPGPEDPLKARWMGFYNGAGIHGTDETWSIGTNASHGCVRMLIPDVIELYDQVPFGTPIYIGN
jgi:lipoprotein-anchoring transpeptidase ErfK/SrfK